MGVSRLLLLLVSALLSRHAASPTGPDAPNVFTLRSVSLTLEPGQDVARDTNVTVRCSAAVSSLGPQSLSREFTIFKDGITVYTKTTSSSEDLLYLLPQARVSHSGKYKCKVSIGDKSLSSEALRLVVNGLSAAVLLVDRAVLSEGEDVKASCTAPGETGSVIFYFYEDLKEVRDERVNGDHAEVTFRPSGPGHHALQCSYTVLIPPAAVPSERSGSVHISVRELSLAPVLDVFPQSQVFEGDQLTLFCGSKEARDPIDPLAQVDPVQVYLSRGEALLGTGLTRLNHTVTVLAQDPAEFECRLEMGNVVKAVTRAVPVTELFSAPVLSLFPAEVFQKDPMKLLCKSEHFAPERLSRDDLTYAIDPPPLHLVQRGSGEFSGKALALDFNYTCLARAKGIVKQSNTLTVRPRVPVSVPKISVVDRAISGRPFRIRCRSDNGSLPINYTLLWDYTPVSTVTVRGVSEEAVFNVTVHRPRDVHMFICEASNSRREGLLSHRLDTALIEPVSDPLMTVIPDLSDISEGSDLVFICSVRGTPPVTFKVYRHGHRLPLFTRIVSENHTSFEVQNVGKDHAGSYSCEAFNRANNVVLSEAVHIEVRLALWKKLLIGGFSLVALCVLAVVVGLCFKSHRASRAVARTRVSVWTERPPQVSEENSVCNEPDVEYTEVVHPRSAARVPLKKGTETVYSELQNSPQDEADPRPNASVHYAELNGEKQDSPPKLDQRPHRHQELPDPVD